MGCFFPHPELMRLGEASARQGPNGFRNTLFEHFDIMTLSIEIDQINNQTLSQKVAIKNIQLKEETEQQFLNDEGVKALQEAFNVKADVKSIKPL